MGTELLLWEQYGLYAVIGVAIAALIYAIILARQVFKEPTGFGKVTEVWSGIKSGATHICEPRCVP
jgi:Na+/H+-translocating membrane pyrophosphatase